MSEPKKTPDEIKKGLWCCHAQYSASCGECPYSNDGRDCGRNGVQIMKDALALIQQLEAESSRKDDTIGNLTELLNAAHDETAQAMRERDALAKDLKSACKLLWSDDSMQCCKFCEHENEPKDTGYCDKCANGNHFKFKPTALCPNMEVQE